MKNNHRGFSLLEVTLVLLIMCIVGVAAIPSAHQIRRQELNQFTREMCLDLVTLRTKEKANSADRYVLELLPNTDGVTYYGYSLRKNGETPKTERNGKKDKMEIILYDVTEGIPVTAINGLTLKKDQLMPGVLSDTVIDVVPGPSIYDKKLIIEVKYDIFTAKIEFQYDTGHYQVDISK